MRLTVGHLIIIIVSGAAGWSFISNISDPHKQGSVSNPIVRNMKSLVGLFQLGEAGKSRGLTNSAVEQSTTQPQDQLRTNEPAEAVPPVVIPIEEKPAQVPVAPVVTPSVVPALQESAKPINRLKRRRKKLVSVEEPGGVHLKIEPPQSAASTNDVPSESKANVVEKKKDAAPSSSQHDLVGRYVSLELVSGNRVKGVLEEKTATHYKVQLPGLGSFLYPVDHVRSVQVAD